ncbi:DUF4494 domain-containing protein [Prevotella melaninogenica]
MMLFEVGVRMERTLENGVQAKVLEQFVVDAMSFTEAEATTTKEVSAYGTITDIVTIKRSRCTELIGDGSKEKWFRAKVNYITIDEKTDKEKKIPNYFFVNAETITDAKKAVDDCFGTTMIDYSVATLDETKVIDVFRHDLNTNNED